MNDRNAMPNDDLLLSLGAQHLIIDLAQGAQATRSANGAPAIVMPRPGSEQQLLTKGQPNDSVVQDLASHGFIEFTDEAFPKPFRLASRGEAYYERILKHH